MRKLIVLALVGLVAQLVDGSLGMGYGVTSSTLLVLAGLTPAAASASVHISRARHQSRVRPLPLAAQERRLEGRRPDRRAGRDRRLPRRDRALPSLDRGGGADHGRHPGRPRHLHHRPVHPRRPAARLKKQLHAQVPRAARPLRRLRRRHRWRRLGSGGHAGAARRRPDGAAQGDRLDRHLRVRGQRRSEPRLHHRPRRGGHQLGLRPRLAGRRPDRRAVRRVPGQDRSGPPARRRRRRHDPADQRPHPAGDLRRDRLDPLGRLRGHPAAHDRRALRRRAAQQAASRHGPGGRRGRRGRPKPSTPDARAAAGADALQQGAQRGQHRLGELHHRVPALPVGQRSARRCWTSRPRRSPPSAGRRRR